MLADELRKLQEKFKINEEYLNKCIKLIDRDLKEFANEHKETILKYNFYTRDLILYKKEDVLPGDPGTIRVPVSYFYALQKHYEKEGITVMWAYTDEALNNGKITFSW